MDGVGTSIVGGHGACPNSPRRPAADQPQMPISVNITRSSTLGSEEPLVHGVKLW